MYPSKGDLHIAPFTDDALFMEQTNKASFWYVKYMVIIYLYSISNKSTLFWRVQMSLKTTSEPLCYV